LEVRFFLVVPYGWILEKEINGILMVSVLEGGRFILSNTNLLDAIKSAWTSFGKLGQINNWEFVV
jgi:hypothetical protein